MGFYRKDPIEEGETPFQELKFKLLNEANAEKHGVDLVHLTQSPKNINEMNQQIMWYAKGSNAAGTPEFKYFSFDNLFNPALNAMNKIGGQEGHCVASTNDNNNDGGFIAVYSWTGSTEGAYRDVVRPSTCGGCSIF